MTARTNAKAARAALKAPKVATVTFKLFGGQERVETVVGGTLLDQVFTAAVEAGNAEDRITAIVKAIGDVGQMQARQQTIAGYMAQQSKGMAATLADRGRMVEVMGLQAYKEGEASNSRRTSIEEGWYGNARQMWSRLLKKAGIATVETRGTTAKASAKAKGAAKEIAKGKAKGEAAGPAPTKSVTGQPAVAKLTSVESVIEAYRAEAQVLSMLQKKNALHTPGVIASAAVAAAKLLTDAIESYLSEGQPKVKKAKSR